MRSRASICEQRLDEAVATFVDGQAALLSALAALDAPVYVTDREGVVTWFNKACIGFTGRRPAVGKDRWCVTWKLYTETGEFLPHDRCPMAETLATRMPVRGVYAVAERPDLTRVTFTPFPTPLFTADGAFAGAVNMLLDVTEARQVAELAAQAKWCRQLMKDQKDPRTAATLASLARECDARAAELERSFEPSKEAGDAREASAPSA